MRSPPASSLRRLRYLAGSLTLCAVAVAVSPDGAFAAVPLLAS